MSRGLSMEDFDKDSLKDKGDCLYEQYLIETYRLHQKSDKGEAPPMIRR